MADITVENLHKEFGLGADKVVALENVNLTSAGTRSSRSSARRVAASRRC